MQKPNVVEISVSTRDLGSVASDALRRDSEVPGIIYGPKLESNIAVAINEVALEKILEVANVQIVRLALNEGETIDALIKQVDFHPVTDRPVHVDFLALHPEVEVTLTIPIKTVGTAKGVTIGGRRFQPLRKLNIRCLPDHIPAFAQANITEMKIGSNLRVKHIQIENVTITDDPRKSIVTIKPPKGGKAGLPADAFAPANEDLTESVNKPL